MDIMISDKSQGTVAKHLRYCNILMTIYCKFTVESAYGRILKSVNIWQSYRQKS